MRRGSKRKLNGVRGFDTIFACRLHSGIEATKSNRSIMVAFPIAKLAYLLVRQIGKPFAVRIKERARHSLFFRTYICMPPAQLYHWIEVNVKMRMLNLGKPTEVPKLNETMAIDLGAELLGEGIVFAVAAVCLIAEYRRTSNRDRDKEDQKEARLQEMQNRLIELELRLAEQEARTRELNHVTAGIHTSVADWWKSSKLRKSDGCGVSKTNDTVGATNDGPPPSSQSSVDIIHKALDEVDRTVIGKHR